MKMFPEMSMTRFGSIRMRKLGCGRQVWQPSGDKQLLGLSFDAIESAQLTLRTGGLLSDRLAVP